MGHHCCTKQKVKRGLWSPEEDEKLVNYITAHGHACWSTVPKEAGLQRCGKSCRLRWINYLKPDVKRGSFSAEEERIIIDAHRILGNRWAQIANHLPGRTDNEVKNFWNSCVKKKLIAQGLDPKTHNLMPVSRSSPSNRVGNNSDELHYSRSNSATSTTAPFTISSIVKNNKSYSSDKMKNTAGFVPSNLMSSLPEAMPPPASDFQYLDTLMSFNDQNSGAVPGIGFADGSSSSSLGHTNLSGFMEDCIWDNSDIDPLETLKQSEEGVQRSLCEIEFDEGNENFELDQMMEFCDGSSMDQLPWD